jgi:signal transduction histidine kinase
MVAAEDRNAVEDQTRRVLAGDEVPVIEHRLIRKDGQQRWVRNTIVQRRDPQGRLLSYDGLIQDITERKRSEEMLRNYATRLQILSSRLMKAREEERRFIAHELHDEIGQLLTGAKLSLDKTRRSADAATAAELSSVQEELNVLMVRVRDLSLNLRPSLLDTLGLLPALQWHFKRYTEQTGVQVFFSHNVATQRLPLELETVIYRVVQEALTNVARHASVGSVNVALVIAEQAAMVTIEDNGDGFDVHAALESGRTMGLTGIRARVDDLGGTLSIRSTPGSGTTLEVSLPLLCMLSEDEKKQNA